MQDFDFAASQGGIGYILLKYKGSARSVCIPKSVIEISAKCFHQCKLLSEVTFEEGSNVKKIGENAFALSGLKSFRVPRSVEELGDDCFCKCESLSEITFEERLNLKRIGAWAFSLPNLKSFRVPRSFEEIGDHWFYACESLSEITFEEGSNLKRIGNWAFAQSGLKSFRVPRSVEELCNECFSGCESLSEIIFEEGSKLKRNRFFWFCLGSQVSVLLPKRDKQQLLDVLQIDKYEVNAGRVVIVEVDSNSTEKPLSDMVIDIAEFERVRKLGAGGFGKVFLYQKGTSLVAAKFIKAQGNQECFDREIENLKSLSHPFIVTLRGFSLPSPKNDYNFVIAMEYISGGSLENVLTNPPSWFDNTSKTEIICGIALGMSFVHSKGIIHRDLKPANVLLDENHLPRVCDFGSSRLFSTDTTMTTSPNVTPVYEAPEVYDKEYTMKIDVYSFGIMLYEIVTGKLAFRNLTLGQLFKHVSIDRKREPIPSSVTPFARDLIERCWSHSPESRPSFTHICALLEKNMDALFPSSDPARISAFHRKYFP